MSRAVCAPYVCVWQRKRTIYRSSTR